MAKINNKHNLIPEASVHPTQQLRLANSINRIFSAGKGKPEFMEILDEIINCPTWNRYIGDRHQEQLNKYQERRKCTLAANPYSSHPSIVEDLWPWLDNPIARQTIYYIFTEY
ncbi:hypothetical protein K438DRAFT_1966477 [Mycena galopus ATCC 62051]|nr:hypothetical protein K438DRAFT_1966477 [Mycena galopus ATCC 62051]